MEKQADKITVSDGDNKIEAIPFKREQDVFDLTKANRLRIVCKNGKGNFVFANSSGTRFAADNAKEYAANMEKQVSKLNLLAQSNEFSLVWIALTASEKAKGQPIAFAILEKGERKIQVNGDSQVTLAKNPQVKALQAAGYKVSLFGRVNKSETPAGIVSSK